MFYNINLEPEHLKLFNMLDIELETILRRVGIYRQDLESNHFQISEKQFRDIISILDKYMDDDFILGFSKTSDATKFNPELFVGYCAENGLECIRRIAKYKKIIAPVKLTVLEDKESVSIMCGYEEGEVIPKGMYLHVQICILSIIRMATGKNNINPIKVICADKVSKSISEYLGETPHIVEGINQITFSKDDLMIPFLSKNNMMWCYLEKELNERLRELDTDKSFSSLVRKILIESLPKGICDADKIATELGVSKRTLQRRLSNENTTFNKQLNHTRELMVRNYLNLGMSVEDITFLVNYAEPKVLARAFKSWTGMSISELKKSTVSKK
ncbi:MAG: hypothetical protein BEN18_04020 [Epulopiscium sp. Nuni2H_MBin001]|nr:MAG: hypothetical protein BEN18_04020 [Epulopiscium sp. Nuni2H_MBin001]